MQRNVIVKLISPWTSRREREQQRVNELRQRDGDSCGRCRRPLRFDLPHGHDQAPTIEFIRPGSNGGKSSKGGIGALDNLCLCHGRCNWAVGDNTPEVMERMRLRA